MIINTTPSNEAVLSNVSETGEFRIRNSAKAFSILSSGLYSNKVRAIIRELSCNAFDSHIAAGKNDTPFDVHLPNALEPWFSIRDYGTGLSHDQVLNIYTTYFESTKTASNEFVGALGLGSKSPFSYTDNFSVIAIKDGVRGIYTAFINEHGVPSIALMQQESSAEPSGVEVKFSVDSSSDYRRFNDEAEYVYAYFKLRPVVSGNSYFTILEKEYKDNDIIPGVHSRKNTNESVAVMGNIPYPIEIPNAELNLGELKSMLRCGLEIHFEIGELDFQASREGLSYIPGTIAAIKNKLEQLAIQLSKSIREEAETIVNPWKQAMFLKGRLEDYLWRAATFKYLQDIKHPLFNGDQISPFVIGVNELMKRCNIDLRVFQYTNSYKKVIVNKKPYSVFDSKHQTYIDQHNIYIKDTAHFVINDIKTGASSRAKYHWKTNKWDGYEHTVYVLEPAVKGKPMNTKKFFRMVHNPHNVWNASVLSKPPVKEKVKRQSNVTILRLEENYRSRNGYTWADDSSLDTFDATTTYYYIPLSGFTFESPYGSMQAVTLKNWVLNCGIPRLRTISNFYGVRKGDIAEVLKQPNWVNFETYICEVLNSLTKDEIGSLAITQVDGTDKLLYNSKNIVLHVTDSNSVYAQVVKVLNAIKGKDYFQNNLEELLRRYRLTAVLPVITATANEFRTAIAKVNKQYPLLECFDRYKPNVQDIAHYINLIDKEVN